MTRPNDTPAYRNASLPVEQRVDDLLSRMTLEEKVGQLNQTFLGWKAYEKNGEQVALTDDVKRLLDAGGAGGIYGVLRADGWTGRNLITGLTPRQGAQIINELQQYAVEHHRLGIPLLLAEECSKGLMAIGATVFPAPICYAGSFDPEMVRNMTAAIALETRAGGANVGYDPICDIPLDPRWSRVEEQFGEDPFLCARMAEATVHGFQGESLNSDKTILSTLKHFAGFGTTEGGRHGSPAHMGERELREMHLPGFRAGVAAGAQSLMCSYNEIDGIPSAANRKLLTDILRGEWGFEGFVIADALAIDELHTKHRTADSLEAAAAMSLEAGLDMSLWDEAYTHLLAAVRNGLVSESVVDLAVGRVLRSKFLLGLFEKYAADPERAARIIGCPEHRRLSRKAAARSIVLLKNENDLLPLPRSIKSVAVIGPNADNLYNQIGNYTAPQDAAQCTTILQGIKAVLGESAVRYAKGCGIKSLSRAGFAEAVEAARGSEIAVVVVGGSSCQDEFVTISDTGTAVATPQSLESDIDCGEGFDRDDIQLSGVQLDLVKDIHATGTPVIVVLVQGRPHAIPWIAENVPAIVCAWYPGTEGGHAVADVLFGDVNPAGRLTISIPRGVGQIPVNYNHKLSVERKYVQGDFTPLYPFGHGLSYTTFRYDNLKINPAIISADGRAEVSVEVTNLGDRAGDEVVQLYVRDDYSSVTRPVKELKGFQRISLAPRETNTVAFSVGRNELEFLDVNLSPVVEPGSFTIMVGGSSADVLSATLAVK